MPIIQSICRSGYHPVCTGTLTNTHTHIHLEKKDLFLWRFGRENSLVIHWKMALILERTNKNRRGTLTHTQTHTHDDKYRRTSQAPHTCLRDMRAIVAILINIYTRLDTFSINHRSIQPTNGKLVLARSLPLSRIKSFWRGKKSTFTHTHTQTRKLTHSSFTLCL